MSVKNDLLLVMVQALKAKKATPITGADTGQSFAYSLLCPEFHNKPQSPDDRCLHLALHRPVTEVQVWYYLLC